MSERRSPETTQKIEASVAEEKFENEQVVQTPLPRKIKLQEKQSKKMNRAALHSL